MNYGWAITFTVAAWIIGSFLEAFIGADTNILFAILAMGCCIMKFCKDNSNPPNDPK